MEWKKKHYDISGHNIESADMSAYETEVEFCLNIQGKDVSHGMKGVEVYPDADCIDSVSISGLNIFSAMRDEHTDEEMVEVLIEWIRNLDLEDVDTDRLISTAWNYTDGTKPEPSKEPSMEMKVLLIEQMHSAMYGVELAMTKPELLSDVKVGEGCLSSLYIGRCESCGDKKLCKKCGGA